MENVKPAGDDAGDGTLRLMLSNSFMRQRVASDYGRHRPRHGSQCRTVTYAVDQALKSEVGDARTVFLPLSGWGWRLKKLADILARQAAGDGNLARRATRLFP